MSFTLREYKTDKAKNKQQRNLSKKNKDLLPNLSTPGFYTDLNNKRQIIVGFKFT